MDRDEQQSERVWSIDKDARINVLVNNSDDDDSINLGRVLHNLKQKRRIYAWVLLLCMAVGFSGALLAYQFTKPMTTVSSVVTLKYEIPSEETDSEDPDAVLTTPVTDLTAPNGEGDLDLNQVTSANVLQAAMNGLQLSHPVTLSNLRSNIRIDKILTEDSRRQQEVAASMIADKNTSAYSQVQEITLAYDNRFIVSLVNGFGGDDARVKNELTDAELQLLLDRILAAYNDYLVVLYADTKLPDDEISVIDTDNLDVLESLDLLRAAVTDLYDYCDAKPQRIKDYRSWRTGRSLSDLMADLQRVKDVNVDYLYSYVYTNSIVKDRDTMITNYEFQLRNAQTELGVINENIATTQSILDNYKNDEIFVSMQESDTSRSTKTTTDYYNRLILQQAENHEKAAKLQTTIADLQDKIDSLNAITEQVTTDQALEELSNAITVCKKVYAQICAQMEEIMNSPFYTAYADHSVAQGKTKSFLSAAAKPMILGVVAGALVACGLWFFAALAPEFSARRKDEKERKEADKP